MTDDGPLRQAVPVVPSVPKVYWAKLTQSGGTSAPTAEVLVNTTGYDVTWSRVAAGVYRMSFPEGVVYDFALCTGGIGIDAEQGFEYRIAFLGTTVLFQSFDQEVAGDGLLQQGFLGHVLRIEFYDLTEPD